jgi:hypothetical protein
LEKPLEIPAPLISLAELVAWRRCCDPGWCRYDTWDGVPLLSFSGVLSVLRTHNIFYLYQAKMQNTRGLILDLWKTSDDLGGHGTFSYGMDIFTRGHFVVRGFTFVQVRIDYFGWVEISQALLRKKCI